MIRVGFLSNFLDQSWLGGINYYRNLIDAILTIPDGRIEPVIFSDNRSDLSIIKELPSVEVIRTNILDQFDVLYYLRHLWRRTFSFDRFLERMLLNHKIDVLSHSGFIGKGARIPTIGWIPDFQHKRMPEFFSDDEIFARDRYFGQTLEHCSCVILSSFAAKKDAEEFYPLFSSKLRVLQFQVGSISPSVSTDIKRLERTYSFKGPYFLLPNQFWIHKNHRVVIEALRILKSKRQNVKVLATGNTHDYRQPSHFNRLVKLAKDYGVSDSFIVLGLVPYSDLVGLMINSLSLINPSLFEGWSTTVEESKALGKRILLSDIPVHREQAPDLGLYFPPNDPEALADLMLMVWNNIQNDGEPQWDQLLKANRQRKINFARRYENIILNALKENMAR